MRSWSSPLIPDVEYDEVVLARTAPGEGEGDFGVSLGMRRALRDEGVGDGLPLTEGLLLALKVACRSSFGGVIIVEVSRLCVLVLGVIGICAFVGIITCERGLAPGEGLAVRSCECGGEGVTWGRGDNDRLGV